MDEIIINNVDMSSIPLKKTTLDVYKVYKEGNKDCIHNWIELEKYLKRYVNKLKPGEETLDNYNPNNEKIIHRLCDICGRYEIVVENINIYYFKNIEEYNRFKDYPLKRSLSASI